MSGLGLAAAAAAHIIRVTATGGAFRRAGRAFGPEAVELLGEDVTWKQLADLVREPRLIVEAALDGNLFVRLGAGFAKVADALGDVDEHSIAEVTRRFEAGLLEIGDDVADAMRGATSRILGRQEIAAEAAELANRDAPAATGLAMAVSVPAADVASQAGPIGDGDVVARELAAQAAELANRDAPAATKAAIAASAAAGAPEGDAARFAALGDAPTPSEAELAPTLVAESPPPTRRRRASADD
ncbi:hypothetical protein PQ455_10410 [Sphingomonas naphthae]|uniref:Uncharacterized protein n=1 Tax=Sphingomonas naphthae TaxID=1813468 RepID=A0ABY7TGJ5_9SPHN|nr:hypothetical protein [Sphingomonas naphthae]WCT72060.1 hypothetical protein PQ455_10410 [Sphingomonas naphthae]